MILCVLSSLQFLPLDYLSRSSLKAGSQVDPPAGGLSRLRRVSFWLISRLVMFTTYTIYNLIYDKIYIGYTSDLAKRIKRHNGLLRNKKKSFTRKNKGNWKLIYSENFKTRKEAIIREKELKSFKGREFIRKFIK